MKKILLTALSLLFAVMIQASSLELYFNGSPLQHGATIQIIGDPSAEYLQARIDVKNISAVAVDVKAKKVIHEGDTLPGTSNYFCWGLCFPPFTYISPNALNIQPGATNQEFYGDYNPNTVIGISRVTYVFFNAIDANDSVAVIVEYNASPASVIESAAGVQFSEAYPNPANSSVKVDYSLPVNISRAEIIITNMLGSRVKEVTLDENHGTVQIPVTDLMNGIYFYSLVGDDQVILTRKFVVKK